MQVALYTTLLDDYVLSDAILRDCIDQFDKMGENLKNTCYGYLQRHIRGYYRCSQERLSLLERLLQSQHLSSDSQKELRTLRAKIKRELLLKKIRSIFIKLRSINDWIIQQIKAILAKIRASFHR